jgi:hypothetical protein
MTPKEKARELVDKFRLYAFTSDYDYAENGAQNEYYNAEKCALIAVDDILYSVKGNFIYSIKFHQYWKEVKQEIETL